MSKPPIIVTLVMGTLVIVALMAFAGGNFLTRFPTDEELIRKFDSAPDDFTALLNMSNEDNFYNRITPKFTRPELWAAPVEKNIEGERWNDYKNRFAKLGLADGIEREYDHSESAYFIAASRGLLNRGRSKGYAYLTNEPTPLLPSLNEEKAEKFYRTHANLQKATLYKRLRKNWYLFFG